MRCELNTGRFALKDREAAWHDVHPIAAGAALVMRSDEDQRLDIELTEVVDSWAFYQMEGKDAVSSMTASAERDLVRRAKHKLAVLLHVDEVSGNVPATCRYFGITRTCFYKWRKRYEAESFEGLNDPSSVPHRSPNATGAKVIAKILWLRPQFHVEPQKIAMYLKRYHEITISPSRVWRILHKAGMSRLPASQRYKRKQTRWKRYEKQCPGHQLRVEAKFIEQLGQTGRNAVTTSTPRSTTAPGCGCCASTLTTINRQPSASSTMVCRAPVRGRASPDRQRQRSSVKRPTDTSSTKASASNPRHPG
ncbi:helix-turn-helix domain-containing protein [Kribbella sp. NPDC051137]|uniref:helix-turn-helix domain-containing protein n=1 Tax=Kribbella sp. NPDC051137 TaxID=3155045 RepID=UPI0034134833